MYEQAIHSGYQLSQGEELLKMAMQTLLEDQQADVTASGKELVRLYPSDPEAYLRLSFFQQKAGDYLGQVATLLKAAEIEDDPAHVFNSLGYTYMAMQQFDDAERALDKYLELKPDEPNPYDSKGDYYMAIEEYGLAYESYMNAVEIDSTWTASLRKAKRAVALINENME